MKIIITGATGMVGGGALLECIDAPQVREIVCVGRNAVDVVDAKVNNVVLKDFTEAHHIAESLRGADACFFCMGVTSVGKTLDEYRALTYDTAVRFADAVYDVAPNCTFVYVSGEGTDSTERGRVGWARIKGETENAILAKGFKQAFMFRPGAIIPERGITSKIFVYRIFFPLLKVFGPIIRKFFPGIITSTSTVGRAMLQVTLHGCHTKVLSTREINKQGATFG